MAVPRDYPNILGISDPSERAAQHLNDILDETSPALEPTEQMDGPELDHTLVAADVARREEQVIQPESERNRVRLLLFTKNVSIRKLGSYAQRRLLELSKMFAEIHVVILNEYTEETVSTVRLADNIWVYSTDSRYWWKMGFDAYTLANEQLVFAGGFRVDVVVAEDPFECGAAGYAVAQKYERPFQVHVLEDIFSAEFKEDDPHPVVRSFLSRFVLQRADTIRTSTRFIQELIVDEFPDLTSIIEVLPVYYNLESWRDTSPELDLKARYPQFNFLILHVSNMGANSHTKEVIQGVAPILRTYPTIGIVIVGNGPNRSALEKQAIALGIHGQVEFEPVPEEILSHMKTANVLIHLSADSSEDMVILEAATVRLPIIASDTNIAGDLFENDDSALLCSGADPACVSKQLKVFLNDNQARLRLALRAQEVVFDRIEQDYEGYLKAYSQSIERGIVVND